MAPYGVVLWQPAWGSESIREQHTRGYHAEWPADSHDEKGAQDDESDGDVLDIVAGGERKVSGASRLTRPILNGSRTHQGRHPQ